MRSCDQPHAPKYMYTSVGRRAERNRLSPKAISIYERSRRKYFSRVTIRYECANKRSIRISRILQDEDGEWEGGERILHIAEFTTLLLIIAYVRDEKR